VTAARKHAGYTVREIEDLHRTFKHYDRDDSGSIERKELRTLLKEAFPWATTSVQRRQWLEELMKKIDVDGNGKLDFEEFLWLMREADDSRDAVDFAAEAIVVPEVGLSIEEAEGFREIFCECADSHGLVALKDVFSLLKFVEFSADQAERIAKLVQEVGMPGQRGINFPAFLKLLQRLYEDKSLGVQQASDRLAGQNGPPHQFRKKTLVPQTPAGSLPDTDTSSTHSTTKRKSSVSSLLKTVHRKSSVTPVPDWDLNKRLEPNKRSSAHELGRSSISRRPSVGKASLASRATVANAGLVKDLQVKRPSSTSSVGKTSLAARATVANAGSVKDLAVNVPSSTSSVGKASLAAPATVASAGLARDLSVNVPNSASRATIAPIASRNGRGYRPTWHSCTTQA